VEGNGVGIHLGDNSESMIENNIFLYTQSFGILNVNNTQNVLLDNIFFQCQEGIYKYLDMFNLSSSSVLLWRKEDLELLNLYPDVYHLITADGNIYKNPDLDIDKFFLSNLVNYWSHNSENISPELLEEWRRNQVYFTDLQDSKDYSKFGTAYKLEDIIPNLLYNGPAGVQADIEFPVYNSETVE
jgi:parallel beta-helix repeat protein